MSLLVAPSDPAEPVGEQVMALKAQELPGELPIPADHLAHGDRGVVVGDLGGHPAEEREGGHVGGLEGLGALPGVDRDVEGVGVGKAHHGEGRLAQGASDANGGVTEVELGLSGRVGQRDEHLGGVPLVASHGLLHLGDAAGVAELVPEAREDALRGVVLLGRRLPVGLKDLLDDREVGSELGLGPGRALPVPGRFGVAKDFLERSHPTP